MQEFWIIKVFEEKTGTKKQIFLSMITTLGLKRISIPKI